MKQIFQIPADVSKITTTAINTIKLTFETQEMSAESAALIWRLREKHGWLFFAETPIDVDDLKIDEPAKEFKEDKTPSQRLRSIFFVYWKQLKSEQDFDSFYKSNMEKIIEQIKSRLEPE
jgi:hypothetical protein